MTFESRIALRLEQLYNAQNSTGVVRQIASTSMSFALSKPKAASNAISNAT
jgi:hypothetical protein